MGFAFCGLGPAGIFLGVTEFFEPKDARKMRSAALPVFFHPPGDVGRDPGVKPAVFCFQNIEIPALILSHAFPRLNVQIYPDGTMVGAHDVF